MLVVLDWAIPPNFSALQPSLKNIYAKLLWVEYGPLSTISLDPDSRTDLLQAQALFRHVDKVQM